MARFKPPAPRKGITGKSAGRSSVPDVFVNTDPYSFIGTDHYMGLPSLRVRQLLIRKANGFSVQEAAEVLLVDLREAAVTLWMLETHGILTKSTDRTTSESSWVATEAGHRLANAEVAPSLDRLSVFGLLVPFTQHVAAVNRREDLAYRVSGLTIIGEPLTASDIEAIPFLELTAILSPRHADDAKQKELTEHCLELGRQECLKSGGDLDKLDDEWVKGETQWAVMNSGIDVALRWAFS